MVVSDLNSRYFENGFGQPVILTGFHTWYNIQDGGPTDPPGAFDWDEYLSALVSYGCNFTKLWASMETAQLWADPFGGVANPQYFSPPRYERTGPGNAADGGLKFDLDQINQDFLDRLYDRVAACAANGIYVTIQLFQGWQIEDKGGSDQPFDYHPYNAANNINSIDGDQDNDGDGTETHRSGAGNVTLSYQEDLVEEIVTLLNGFDNIIWEISNEDTGHADNTTWQEAMISHIASVEAGLSKQHPIGRTVSYPNGSNAALDASAAAWVSYSNRDEVDGTKVSMSDTDHIEGITSDHEWVWISLCNGHGGLWYMDEWANEVYGTGDRRNDATYQTIRANLGYARELVDLLDDLAGMTPQAALCTTGYCLAKDHATQAEYICFQSGSGAFDLDLSTATGTLNIRWLRCSDGTIDTGSTASGGDVRTLTPPWAGAVVAYVFH
ncbi:MAG: hypothetical protein BroJett011_62870 [Chloroflexota bacterium]|nr:MAG: hypothetical protein BroJett011_62870 [Chloroflexota bacterium]